MRTLLIVTSAALALAACGQPEPLCDRETQPWDKFDTQEDSCAKAPSNTVHALPDDGPRDVPQATDPDPTDDPEQPDQPNEPGDPAPEGKTKGDNGWGTGDKAAPGNSLGHTRAENSETEHRKHGQGNPN